MSSQVPPNEQGELQGALTSLMSLTSIFGPLLMGGLFTYFTEDGHIHIPGAPMFMGACLTIISVFLARASLKKNMK
jgi:DHA1 family tetracycline resistance protein-like MFS transporter